MHIVVVVVIGLIVLTAFFFGASLIGRGGSAGAFVFIWLWLVIAVGNGAYGVLRAGLPVINEIVAFIPIFGIPAAAAWYLAFRYGAGR